MASEMMMRWVCHFIDHHFNLKQLSNAFGDNDEVGVSFYRSPLSFETALKLLLYFQSVANNPLKC